MATANLQDPVAANRSKLQQTGSNLQLTEYYWPKNPKQRIKFFISLWFILNFLWVFLKYIFLIGFIFAFYLLFFGSYNKNYKIQKNFRKKIIKYILYFDEMLEFIRWILLPFRFYYLMKSKRHTLDEGFLVLMKLGLNLMKLRMKFWWSNII